MEIGDYDRDTDLVAACRRDRRPRLRVRRPDGVQLVLGLGSRPERELHMAACQADGVAVLRRRGGGCAVVLEPGQLVLAAALHAPGLGGNRAWFDAINAAVIAALQAVGLPAPERAGISDLALGGRKVAGASLHRGRDTLYYAASLLVAPRVELMTRYLQHPPREPAYRCGRAHADFVRGLAEHLAPPAIAALAPELATALQPRIAALGQSKT